MEPSNEYPTLTRVLLGAGFLYGGLVAIITLTSHIAAWAL